MGKIARPKSEVSEGAMLAVIATILGVVIFAAMLGLIHVSRPNCRP
jgi:hypothetical protein